MEGLEPSVFLVSQIYSLLPSPLGYTPGNKKTAFSVPCTALRKRFSIEMIFAKEKIIHHIRHFRFLISHTTKRSLIQDTAIPRVRMKNIKRFFLPSWYGSFLSFFLSLLYHRNFRKAIQPVVVCPALCVG